MTTLPIKYIKYVETKMYPLLQRFQYPSSVISRSMRKKISKDIFELKSTKTVQQWRTKLNIVLSHNLVIMILGLCLIEFKAYVHTKTCPSIFLSTLFISLKSGSNQDVFQYVTGQKKNQWYSGCHGFREQREGE